MAVAQTPPKQDHESAIRENQIGLRHGGAINLVALEAAKAGARWRDDEATPLECAVDCLSDAAVEEVETENLHVQLVAGIGDPGEREPRNATGITDPGYNLADSCYTARTLKAIEQLSRADRTGWVLGGIALLSLWLVLCRFLAGEWSVNEQYSYGWFVPLFAAFLFWLRWEDRPKVRIKKEELRKGMELAGAERHGRQSREGSGEGAGASESIAAAIAIAALVILLPVRLFEVANPDWRPLGWLHAFAVIAITFVVIGQAGGWPWIKHFSFPILFFLVAVPWVSPIEQPIVQGLMQIIASLAAETISLLGIPADVQGNLIRISSGVVGVNEACSGVRSLQTSIMIGLLFGELKRFGWQRRLVLLAVAIAIALVANLGRAIFLVWIASTRELSAVDRWHDVAGYVIVAAVFLGSLGLTALLARGASKVKSKKEEVRNRAPSRDLSSQGSVLRSRSPFILLPSYFFLSLAWLVSIEIGVEGWYRAHEKNLVVVDRWNVRLPEKAPGFRELKIDENVRQTLRFDTGRELTWKSTNTGGSDPTTNYLYFFRWNPGSSSVVRARAHRPDICLPSTGWKQTADRGLKNYAAGSGIVVPAHHAVFTQGTGNVTVHTFFSLQEDKVRPDEARPDLELAPGIQPDWSVRARLQMVRRGVRNLGQQVLEFVLLSNHPMDDRTAEEKFAQTLRELIVAESNSP